MIFTSLLFLSFQIAYNIFQNMFAMMLQEPLTTYVAASRHFIEFDAGLVMKKYWKKWRKENISP